jgi:hypothetical protein
MLVNGSGCFCAQVFRSPKYSRVGDEPGYPTQSVARLV